MWPSLVNGARYEVNCCEKIGQMWKCLQNFSGMCIEDYSYATS